MREMKDRECGSLLPLLALPARWQGRLRSKIRPLLLGLRRLILPSHLARYGAPAEAGASRRLKPALHCSAQVTLFSTIHYQLSTMNTTTTSPRPIRGLFALSHTVLACAALAVMSISTPFGKAAITQNNATGVASGFTVSATDLVNQGSSTLTSATRSHAPMHGNVGDTGYDVSNSGTGVIYANDGQIGDFVTSPWGKNVEWYPSTQFGWPTANALLPVTYTFALNTSTHSAGYDISNITSTCGYLWNKDWCSNQVFQVEITKDGSTWVNLGTYNYKPYTGGTESAQMTQVGLSNTGGGALDNGTYVAKNVTGIRITYLDPGNASGSDFNGTAIKEIDVVGAPSAALVVSAASSTVTASPTSVASDGVTPSTLTVTLKDAGGAAIPGKTVSLVSNRGLTDTITPASGSSNGSGVVTFTVKSTTAGAPVFTATDTSDSVTVTQTATVTFLSDVVSAANSTVAASPASVEADGSSTSTITVTLKNANNNPLAGKAVALAKTSGPGSPTITTLVGTTDGSGVATFTVKSTTAGADVFTATETEDSVVIAQTATVTFTAGAVTAGTSTVVASPATVPADGVATSTVTVTLKDVSNNAVSGKDVTLVSSRLTEDAVSPASGFSSASGVVTFTVTSLTAGSSVFTATGDSVALSTTPTVTFAPLVIVQTNASTHTSSENHAAGGFTASASDLVNQGQATLSAATRSHAPLFGDPVGANYDSSNAGPVPVYVNDGQIGDFSTSPWGKNVELFANTTASGWVTANELLPVTYTFALNTTLHPAGYDINNITSTCGWLWNRDWLADQKFQVEITQDGSTWLDLGTYSYIPVTNTSSSSGTFETQVVLNNPGGSALNTGTHAAKNVRAIRVTYLSTNLPSPDSNIDGTAIKEIDVFGQPSVPLVGNAASSTVTASPTTVANDGVSTSTITVTLKDAASIPVVGKTVTLASSRTTTDTISPASGVSNISGVVTFTVKSTTPGTAVFTATDVTDSNLVLGPSTASVTFSATAVSTANSTVAVSPATVTADGTLASAVTVTLKNVGNAAVTGQTVTLASSRGASDTILPASGISNGSGVVSFAVKSTTMGAAVLTASVTDDKRVVTQTGTVNFIAGAVNAAHSTVTATPSSVLADGTTPATITVTLKDAYNNPVAGKSVTLARNGNTGAGSPAIIPVSGTTSAVGVATFTVACITAGTYDFLATDVTDSNLLITQAATVDFASGLGNIMPMGDSITLGVPVSGGYRDPLFTLLYNRGHSFTFVGSLTDNASQTLIGAGQTHHEGHSGYVIAAGGGRPGLDENLVTWIGPGAAAPEKILLMIGSNDINLGYDMSIAPTRLSTLITHIYDYRPNVKLYVASIIPMTGHESDVQAFNATIPGIVANHQALGQNVVYVPMYEAMNINTDLVDGLHPNALGYQHMAQAWDAALHPLPYDTWTHGTFANGTLTDPTPTGDPDGDGMTNQQEFAFGLDPTTGASVNPCTPLLGNQFSYTKRATSGLSYTVEYSTDLAHWNPASVSESVGAANSNGVQTVTVTVSTPALNGKLFVRVKAL